MRAFPLGPSGLGPSGLGPCRLVRSALPLCALVAAACGAPEPLVTVLPAPPPPADAGRGGPGASRPTPPGTTETLFGKTVADPYRWLEDEGSPDTKRFLAGEADKFRGYMERIPERAKLAEEIGGLVEVGYVGAPRAFGTGKDRRYFHTRRTGAQKQPVLYVRDGAAGTDRPLVDVAALSADATVSLDWWYPSHEGKLLAWGRSDAGSEESTLYVRDVATGKDLADRIPRTRYSSVAWLPGGKAFFYTRYPEPGSVPPGEERYHVKVYRHELGADPALDRLIFAPREKTDMPQVVISPNGKWLVVRVHQGWAKSELHLLDLDKDAAAVKAAKDPKSPPAPAFVELATKRDAVFNPVVRDDRIYVHTNDGAPRYRLFAVDPRTPERAKWKELVAEGADVLTDVAVSDAGLALSWLKDAASVVAVTDREGKNRREVALPTVGTAHVSAPATGGEAFVEFVSFVTPPRVLRVAMAPTLAAKAAAAPTVWAAVGADLKTDGIVVRRAEATSKDGTRVPMFIVEQEGGKGARPTLLWGYGGFNVNQTPAFSARALVTARRGGQFVSAVLRGGGEFGEAWHRAGMLEKKQNVFDDFIACAETLIKEGRTTAKQLAIGGGSNGGLLTAAAVVQRPELFRAALSLVPLTDMVRYTRFQLARLWIPEYGDPEKAEHFPFLFGYSPYHRVAERAAYPAVLFATADSDTRVDPMHARKMAARLAAAQASDRPVLLRVEPKAGHGAGKPTTKVIAQIADELAFVLNETGAFSR